MNEHVIVPPSNSDVDEVIAIPEHATPQDIMGAIATRIRVLQSTGRLTEAGANCTPEDTQALRAALGILLKMNPDAPIVASAPNLTDVSLEAASQVAETSEPILDDALQVEAPEGEMITPQRQLDHIVSLFEAIVATPDLPPERKDPLTQAIQDIRQLVFTIQSIFVNQVSIAKENGISIPDAQTIARGFVTRSEIKTACEKALCLFNTLFENGKQKKNEDTKQPNPSDLVTLGKGLGVELENIGEHAKKRDVFVLCDEAPGSDTQYYMLRHEQQAPVEGGDPTKREAFHLRVRDDMLPGWEITYYFSKNNGTSTTNIVKLVPPPDFLLSLIQSVIEEQLSEQKLS